PAWRALALLPVRASCPAPSFWPFGRPTPSASSSCLRALTPVLRIEVRDSSQKLARIVGFGKTGRDWSVPCSTMRPARITTTRSHHIESRGRSRQSSRALGGAHNPRLAVHRGYVESAFLLVLLLPPPAARALRFAGRDGTRAGRASNRRKSFGVQRIDRDG